MGLNNILKGIQPVVFWVSVAFLVLFSLFGALFTETAAQTFNSVQGFFVDNFDWFYVLAATGCLIFIIWLVFSRFSHIRLGKPGSRPEFSNASWFSMLFSAGMGIGLVYWGVAEPLLHYLDPPTADPGTGAALRESMRATFFHWGLHPWAIYAVIGLPLAYFHFRHDLPMTPSSIFYPLLGERVRGPIGFAIDVLTVVATVFGIATSLGLGVLQVNTGMNLVFGLPQTRLIQMILIAVITFIATMSVVTGLRGGVKRLSEINIGLAGLLMLFVFLLGPTVYIMDVLVSTTGDYLQNLISISFWVNPDPTSTWQSSWTLFYWGWWISWAPFVGIFIARISKGRTIREFILGVMLVPTAVTFIWFSVFGGAGLFEELFGTVDLALITQQDETLGLFTLLSTLPLEVVTLLIATLVIVLFFITSSDSGSLVVDAITSGGTGSGPVVRRAFWAVAVGGIAAVLLLTGGLNALQTAAIATGFPMAILMLAMIVASLRGFQADMRVGGPKEVPTLAQLRGEGLPEEKQEN